MLTITEPQTAHVPVVLDLDDLDSSCATGLDDGRVSIDLGIDVTIVGTHAQLLDLGHGIVSHAHGIAAERAAAEEPLPPKAAAFARAVWELVFMDDEAEAFGSRRQAIQERIDQLLDADRSGIPRGSQTPAFLGK